MKARTISGLAGICSAAAPAPAEAPSAGADPPRIRNIGAHGGQTQVSSYAAATDRSAEQKEEKEDQESNRTLKRKIHPEHEGQQERKAERP